jgi:hypothetical protein
MRKLVKLAIAAALLTVSFLGSTPEAAACIQICGRFQCIPGSGCMIRNGCAVCVPNGLGGAPR